MAKIKVAIAGINGRMGRAAVSALVSDEDFELVGAFGRAGAAYIGQDLSAFVSPHIDRQTGVKVAGSFEDMLASANSRPDILLDNMIAAASFETAQKALAAGIRPVIGTSGLSPEMVATLKEKAGVKSLGGMIVPNFSIGAVLMMEFAQQAAKHFGNVEVVEMHNPKKVDAPSGTAMHTLYKIASTGAAYNPKKVDEHEILKGARGALHQSGVRVHSLRMPGPISHQDVMFAGEGEMLTIRHDSFNTSCFIKGIVLALKSTMQLSELKVGLESVL